MKKIIALFFFLASFTLANAQTQFVIQGNASNLGGGIFQITPNSTSQAGIITSMYTVDLATTFSLTFDMNFGSIDGNGADGMAFVINGECSPTLGSGQSLGTDNMNPSIVAKFDTYENTSGTRDDIAADHIGLYKNGILNAANRLNGAPVSANGANIENGAYHTVIINWTYIDANTQKIDVTFDGTLKKTATGDYINGIFGGTNLQFWSITGSTGSKTNDQRVRFSTTNNQNQTSTCPGDAKQLIAPDRGSSYVWSPAPDAGQGTKTADVTPFATTTYTCSFNDYCGTPRSLEFTVTTPAEIKLSSTLAPTAICSANTFTYNATSTSSSPSFSWTKAAVPGITEGATSGSGDISETLTNTTSSPINVTYVYTITSGTCVGASENVVVSVNPDATLTLTSAPGTDNEHACLGYPMIDIEYTGNSVVTGATDTGLPPGVSGSFGAGIYTISGTPSVDGIYDYTVTSTGNCVQTSVTGQINVGFPLLTANNVQRVCKGTAISDIVYSVAGGNAPLPTTDSGLPPGVAGSYNAGTEEYTLSGSPTVEGIFSYTVTGQGSCGSVSILTGTITSGGGLTNPNNNIQQVCKGSAILPIIYDIVGGNAPIVTFDGGLPAGVTGNYNAGTELYTINGTPSVEGTFDYTVTAQGSCGSSSSFYGTITSGVGLATTGTDTQQVCKNAPITDIVYNIVGGDVPAPTIVGLPDGVTGTISSPGVFTISGTPTIEGTFRYTVTTNGSCNPQSSLSGMLTIGAGLVTPGTDTQQVCKNAPITDIVYNIVGGDVPAPTVVGLPDGVTGAISSPGVFTISGTPTVEGTFRYTVATNGSCGPQSSLSGMLTIGAGLVTPGTDTQTVCKNSPITNIVYNIVGGDVPAPTVVGLPDGVTGAISSPGVYTISGTPTVEGTFRYTITTNGSCNPQSSLSGMLTIGVGLVTPGTDTQQVCKNSPITDIVYNINGGDVPPPTITGLPDGVTGSISSPGVFTISGTPTVEGTFRYNVSTNGTCGTQGNLSGMITVGIGIVTPGTDTQSVCKNSPITNIDYNVVGGDAPAPAVVGLPDGVTGAISSPGVFTISGTPTVEGTYRYTVTTNGSCNPQSSLSGMLTIGIGLATPGTDTQSVCKDSPITNIVYNFVGGGTPTLTGALPDGVTGGLTSPGVFTISGTPTTEGTYRYTVTTTGTCSPQSNLSGMLTIGAGLVTPGTDTQSVCKNSPITNIVYNIVGGDAPAPAAVGLPDGVTGAISSPGVFTISGTPTVEGTYRYTVTTNGSCNPQSSLSGMLTIGIGLATPGTDTQSVCKNSPITNIVYNFVGGGTPTLTGALPDGVTGGLTSPGVFTISGTPTTEGTYRYTVTTTGTCSPQSNLSGMLTIGIGLVTPGTDTQSVCKNSPITNIVYNIVGGDAPTPTVVGLPDGVTGAISSPGVFTISGTPTVEGTYRYTVTTNGSCNPQSSLSGMLTIGIGLATPGTDTQTVCKNSPITNIVYNFVGGGTPTLTGALPGGVTGSLTSPGVFAISGTPTIEGTYRYTITTTGTCSPQSNLSGMLTIGIGLVTPGTDTQSVCKNSPIANIIYNFAGGGTPTISGLPRGVTGGLTSPGVYTISGTPTVEGTYRYTITTTGTCSPQSNLSGMLTIGIGLVTPGTDTQRVCKNSPITNIVYNFVGGGTPTVTGSLPRGVTGGLTSPGVFTISGTPTIEGTYRYTITTTGTCSPQSNLSGMLTIGIGLVTPGTDTQTVCQGSPIVNIVYDFVGGSILPPSVTGLPTGVTGSITSPGVFTISGTPAVAGVYNYTITTNGTCNPQSKLFGQITVDNATATLSLTSGLGSDYQKICLDSSIINIVYIIGGTGTGAVVSTLPNGLTGIYTAGVFIISGTPIVADGTYTYTITPTGGSCPSAPETFTITVMNPIANFTSDEDSGMPPLQINFTNSSQNANTYNWTFGDGNISTAIDTSNTYATNGVYTVQLIASNNSQCPDTATSIITAYKFVVTNVFTPNGDNINDIFTINTIGIMDLSAEIFNRWGLKMYEWDLTKGGWDGVNMINGMPCTSGTYFYIIKAKDMDGKEYNESGFLELIR